MEVIGYSPAKGLGAAIAGIGGIGHILIAVGLVWTLIIVLKGLRLEAEPAK